MWLVTGDDVRASFTMRDAIEAMETAVKLHASGGTFSPRRHQLATKNPEGEILAMPGTVDPGLFGIKVWYHYAEPPQGMPQTSATLFLLDPERGRETLLDGQVITDFRTGALTALAAKQLARPDSATLGIIGAGNQARTQILALLEVLPQVRSVRVFARDQRRLSSFVEDLQTYERCAGVNLTAVDSAREACETADVMVAATTSHVPVIADEWVAPGALVCGVGSHQPGSSELDPRTVARAELVVVDTYDGALAGAGDISNPIGDGLLDRNDVLELGCIVDGSYKPELSEHAVKVFKSVGFAAADVVAGALVARRAAERNLGLEIHLH
jgi:ornithine cyclodeaminase/alanine dehydrogenase-like protein (mu-crystallin family)